MNWKTFMVSVVTGTILGTFCALHFFGLYHLEEELMETETHEKVQAQVMFPEETPYYLELEDPPEENNKSEPILEEKKYNTAKEVNPVKELDQVEKNIIFTKPPMIPDLNEPQKSVLRHRNKELNNYNIMFFGIEDKKLQMLTVYSINRENNWKSGTVFIPTDTLVPGTKDMYLADYFYHHGAEKVEQLVEDAMEININYYVKVDRNLLLEVEPYLDPIYIDGKKVNLAQLFTKEITPQDEIILASLLKNLTKPSIYFGVLPRLVLTCKEYIVTDFELNWTNLWVHYQIAKNIDTTAVTKRIITGKYHLLNNKKYWIPTQEAWWNMVYDVTK